MQTTSRLVLAAGLALAGSPTALAQAENPSFNLLNRGTTPITELFVTPAGDARWGQNRLRQAIPAGGRFAVRRRVDGNCIFDIRVVFADHHILDRRNLNTCKTDDVPVGDAAAAGARAVSGSPFQLLNQATQPIDEFFATPAGFGNWGQNRLADPLAPGAARAVPITRQPPNSCLYDLKVVFADHSMRERHRTDLCRISELPVR